MKLFRLLIPMSALLALLALSACGDDGGNGNGGADGGGADTVGPGGDGGGGTDATVDDSGGGGGTDATMDDDTNGVTDGDVSDDDTGDTDDPDTGGGDDCEPACGDCQTCVDGQCVDQCDADNCETCVAGTCTGCPDGQFCNGDVDPAACEDAPDVACVSPNANGYCDASIVDELVIAEAPAEGVEGCCCDFTGDGNIDNQLSLLVGQLGGMAGFDLPTLNQTVAESLAEGDFIILLEFVGLAAAGADTPFFNMNFFLGADTDADPADNFSGTEEFEIMAESMLNGEPLITFEGASVAGGALEAGPAQFVVPVQLEDPPLDLTLTVDEAIMRADIAWGANGYELSNGELCGVVTIDQIFDALNGFAASSCACLNLDGDLITGAAPTWTCSESTAEPTCDPEDPETGDIQEICGTIATYCSTAVLLLPGFLDVDLDGDETADAISLGATFGATSAVLVGVEGGDM